MVLSSVQVGEYAIMWNDVAGYLKPSSETKMLASGDTITFIGDYLHRTGTVVIDQSPDALEGAGWVLTGPANVSRSGDSVLVDMPVGSYTITWNSVSGYHSPPSELKVLAAGDTITFSGIYSMQVGTIVIVQSPNSLEGAGWHLSGPVEHHGSGDTILASIPVGESTITWNEVDGYFTPEAETEILRSGETITFIGTYVRQTGVIVIDQEPGQLHGAGWTLVGPACASGSEDTTLVGMPVGTYSIVWNRVSGYESPANAMKVLGIGETISFVGTYVRQTGVVVIDQEPDDLAGAGSTLQGQATIVDQATQF